MSSEKTPKGGGKAPATREERLKAALKANLQRRKAQGAARGGKNDSEKAG